MMRVGRLSLKRGSGRLMSSYFDFFIGGFLVFSLLFFRKGDTGC